MLGKKSSLLSLNSKQFHRQKAGAGYENEA